MRQPIVIVGGGLAGLVAAIALAKARFPVLLFEKKEYPHHKVCGEYVSNEVLAYLRSLGVDPFAFGAKAIDRFRFTTPSGRQLDTQLPLGGFGISRYTLDNALYQQALRLGVEVQTGALVKSIDWQEEGFFTVGLASGQQYTTRVVLGAFGKRTPLDKKLNRAFMQQPSPYVGVKYHIRYDFPTDLIALHNFKDGYCGISAIEEDKYCLCYLTKRTNIRQQGAIAAMEQAVMGQNPHLAHIFKEAEFLYDKPEVINEISFAPKRAVEQHILMIGDTAGLITPLCGNGMAMAIRGAKLAADSVIAYAEHDRAALERSYTAAWQIHFATRLRVGRTIQRLFGHEYLSEAAWGFFKYAPPLLSRTIRATHGEPME